MASARSIRLLFRRLVSTGRWALVIGCGPAAAGAAPPTARPATAGPPTASAAPAAVDRPSPEQIADDLRATSRGFGGLDDHIGPDAVRAIVSRLRAHPAAYLDVLRATYVDGPLSVDRHAALDLAAVLGELYSRAPARASDTARALSDRYRRALPGSAADVRRALERHIQALEVIEGGIDVPPARRATRQVPDEICPRTAPGRVDRPALMVRRECTCGETLSCRASVSNQTIRVEVLAASGACRDCTEAFTTCTLPDLAPSTTYSIAVELAGSGHVGARATGASGLLSLNDPCLRPLGPRGSSPGTSSR
jgi:hypothetical protein